MPSEGEPSVIARVGHVGTGLLAGIAGAGLCTALIASSTPTLGWRMAMVLVLAMLGRLARRGRWLRPIGLGWTAGCLVAFALVGAFELWAQAKPSD